MYVVEDVGEALIRGHDLRFHRWRRSAGHSYDEYSQVSKESLVHRVCKMDKSLESSGIQVALMETLVAEALSWRFRMVLGGFPKTTWRFPGQRSLRNISRYLKSEAPGLEGFFTGQILCIVALICWYLMVAKEVSHALALHRGIAAMPRGATKLDTRENPFTHAA